MPAKRKNTRKQTNSKKKAPPTSLNLVLKRLDKIDQHLETLEQNTTAEFKAVREEIAQGRRETTTEFKAVRGEMAQGFDSLRQEFKTELQKEFEKHGAGIHQHKFVRDRDILDAEHQDLKRDVETLKKRDMEKAAAIERIEKQIKAA